MIVWQRCWSALVLGMIPIVAGAGEKTSISRNNILALGAQIGDFPKEAKAFDPAIAAVFTALTKQVEKKGNLAGNALQLVDRLCKRKDVNPLEKLVAAQKILVAVSIWRRLRQTNADDNVELTRNLAGKLFWVRRQLLNELHQKSQKTKSWTLTEAFADALEKAYPGKSQNHIADVWRKRAKGLIRSRQFRAVRSVLERLQDLAPLAASTKKIEGQLEKEAERLRSLALSNSDKEKAKKQLRQALGIWPWLPSARDQLLQREGKYRILRVAVPRLPENFMPETARTDEDWYAVELLYESLVRWHYDDESGSRIVNVLANRLPLDRSLSRQFTLPVDARWSDGSPITITDVRRTVDSLRRPGRTTHYVWTDLLEPPLQDRRLRTLDFGLRREFFEPLKFFDFKILGQPMKRGNGAKVSRTKPLGSGPYVYRGRKKQGKSTYALFTANPYFARAGRSGLPKIREIRFTVAKQDTKKGALPAADLWLGLTDGRIARLQNQTQFKLQTLRNRRVFFLAVNHRKPVLQNTDLRRALAFALDREAIVNQCFRGTGVLAGQVEIIGGALAVAAGKPASGAHQTLNGVFPASSWAVAPPQRVAADLYNREKAGSLLKQAVSGARLQFTLKFPNTDPRFPCACRQIAKQIESIAAEARVKLKIKPVSLSSADFYRARDSRDYDLALCHWDFRTEHYEIWPLFDPSPAALAKGGCNYLGYINDGELLQILRQRWQCRNFHSLRRLTHNLHGRLNEKMPLLPLWQLDTSLAHRPRLRMTEVDPIRIFANAARWEMQE